MIDKRERVADKKEINKETEIKNLKKVRAIRKV